MIASTLACSGCGYQPEPSDPVPFRCPNSGDGRDHVLRRILTLEGSETDATSEVFRRDEPNPFLRYRKLLHSYRSAIERGVSDDEFVDLVAELDAAVAGLDGTGFRETRLLRSDPLARALAVATVWVKDETGNVSGSHKARHLFGLMLWLRLQESVSAAVPLAIASCGNAALGAAVVARAAGRELDVFVPPHAEPAVVERLRALGSRLEVCERRESEIGDPCYLRFREAVESGSLPFTCQGNENGLTIDGGKTLAWEMVSQLARSDASLDRLFIQVGGGALATACIQALREARRLGVLSRMPRIHAVQSEGAHPLERAYERIVDRVLERAGEGVGEESAPRRAQLVSEVSPSLVAAKLAHASAHRSDYMWAWETEPKSIADGILDDETYDWLAVVQGMLATGGWPITVSEEELVEAHRLGRSATGVAVEPTGTAGLAGAMQLSRQGVLAPEESVGLLFTGVERA